MRPDGDLGVCKHCHRRIRWARTRNGRWMPLDPDPNPSGNVRLRGIHPQGGLLAEVLGAQASLLGDADDDEPRYMPHHASCPDLPPREDGRRR